MINHSKSIPLPISFFTRRERERERERERSETRFLMGSELLHKRRDFVNAFMGWRRDSAWAVSTEELTMEKKD
jgi:hypothetical protein